MNLSLPSTVAWLNEKLPRGGDLFEEDRNELFKRIQLDNLPLVVFWDKFSKWVVALDERIDGTETLEDCYWVESGFQTNADAVRWIQSQFGLSGDAVKVIGRLQLQIKL